MIQIDHVTFSYGKKRSIPVVFGTLSFRSSAVSLLCSAAKAAAAKPRSHA